MGGGGGGQNTNTVQSATPWAGVQPGLMGLYGQGAGLFAQGGPQVYMGPTVSPMNVNQNHALDSLTSLNYGGWGQLNPNQAQALNLDSVIANGQDVLSGQLLNTAQGKSTAGQALTSMLNPSYLNVSNNPALNNAMNAANYNTTFNFQNAVMPSLASQFSAAGRFGSGAQTQGINQATNNLASQISNTNAGMASNAYSQLLQNQLGAAGTLGSIQQNAAGLLNNRQGSAIQMLPGLATQGAQNAMYELQAGNMRQGQSQNVLSGQIGQFQAQQAQPYSNANWYAQLLAGGNPFGTTSTSGQQTSQANPFTSALGAGLLGNSLYQSGALGAMGGLLGGGAATGLGGALFSTGAAAAAPALMPSLLGGMGMMAMF